VLVQALAEYAMTYLESQLENKAFEEKLVPYMLQVHEDGRFAGVRECFAEVRRGKKTVSIPVSMQAPKSPVNRNTGIHPLLGCDAVQYALGLHEAWTKAGDEDKHRKQQEGFVELVRQAARETGDKGLEACAKFYDLPGDLKDARVELAAKQPKPGSLIALAVVPRDPSSEDQRGAVVEKQAVRDWWTSHYESSFAQRMDGGAEGTCLVCGRLGSTAPTHDKIKGASKLGGQPSGVSLMSFDKSAFRSYGWEKNANSPVDADCATAYVAALNDLMRLGKHRRGASPDTVVRTRFDCGGVGFLFWTGNPSNDDVASLFEEADPDDIAALLAAPLSGSSEATDTTDPNEFFMAAVSGNGGRLLVRYWFQDKLANVRGSIANWFADLRVADVFHKGESSAPPKLWELLAAIGSRGRTPADRAKSVPSDRAVQLMRRALHGLPLGRTILAAGLTRLRAEKGNGKLNPVRMGLVRMCVNDIERMESKGGPTMAESLDEDLHHPAYVCGRLLAVYDRLQYAAQGAVNVTVADRYYSMASTLPQVGFVKLENFSKAHLKKLRRDNPGAAVNIEREISELMGRLGAKFPASFDIEGQGRFAIGLHHQKAEDQRRIAEVKARKAEAAGKVE